jgi:hypothetical protein
VKVHLGNIPSILLGNKGGRIQSIQTECELMKVYLESEVGDEIGKIINN